METVYIVDFEDRPRGVVFSTLAEAQKYAAAFCGGIDRHRKTAMEMPVYENAKDLIRDQALRKLTLAEKQILGLVEKKKEFPLL